MANTSNSNTVSLIDGTLTFFADGDYSFSFLNNGKVKIALQDGQTTLLSADQFAGVSALNLEQGTHLSVDASLLEGIDVEVDGSIDITGVSFTEADEAADFKFEPSTGVDVDAIIKDMIAERGVTETLENLSVNGSEADAFKLVWDHLDDNYSYYNLEVNDAFIDLGIAYASYLLEGGEALTDTTVKFTPDNADSDVLPQRSQSLHDNILGNFDQLSITDKFGAAGDDAIFARIVDAGLGALLGDLASTTDGRPIYGGYDYQDPTATRTFDDGFFFA